VARWRLLDWLIPFYCMYVDARSSVFRTGWELFSSSSSSSSSTFHLIALRCAGLPCTHLPILILILFSRFYYYYYRIYTSHHVLPVSHPPTQTCRKKTYVSMSRNDQHQCQHYDQNLLPHTSHVHFPACDRPVAACGMHVFIAAFPALAMYGHRLASADALYPSDSVAHSSPAESTRRCDAMRHGNCRTAGQQPCHSRGCRLSEQRFLGLARALALSLRSANPTERVAHVVRLCRKLGGSVTLRRQRRVSSPD
jgi:hypothetical protein